MDLTTNYSLKKPSGADVVNIDDFNYNADLLDSKIKTIENQSNTNKSNISTLQSEVSANKTSILSLQNELGASKSILENNINAIKGVL